MDKSATHLKIPFSLSREHTSNFKYHDTTEMYQTGIFQTFSHYRFFLESTLSVWIQSYIFVQF